MWENVIDLIKHYCMQCKYLEYNEFIYRETGIPIRRSPANSTTFITDVDADNSNVHWIFRIGFMYYSLLGSLIVLVVGYPISILTGGAKDLDEKLLAPFLRKSYRKNVKLSQEAKQRFNINDQEMETLQKS